MEGKVTKIGKTKILKARAEKARSQNRWICIWLWWSGWLDGTCSGRNLEK